MVTPAARREAVVHLKRTLRHLSVAQHSINA
jgi:hypothetical protein